MTPRYDKSRAFIGDWWGVPIRHTNIDIGTVKNFKETVDKLEPGYYNRFTVWVKPSNSNETLNAPLYVNLGTRKSINVSMKGSNEKNNH